MPTQSGVHAHFVTHFADTHESSLKSSNSTKHKTCQGDAQGGGYVKRMTARQEEIIVKVTLPSNVVVHLHNIMKNNLPHRYY